MSAKTSISILLVASSFFLCLVTKAEDWTINGKTLHNVVVGNVYPDRVEITFDGGVGTPLLKDLSPELQKRFNYNPNAANVATQKRDADQKAALISYAAIQSQQANEQDQAETQQKAKDVAISGATEITGKVFQVVSLDQGQDKAYLIDRDNYMGNPTGQLVLVFGLPDSYVDGDRVTSDVKLSPSPSDTAYRRATWFYAGIWRYKSVSGAMVTCRIFSPNLDGAIKRLLNPAQ